jgi:hypothetical protein
MRLRGAIAFATFAAVAVVAAQVVPVRVVTGIVVAAETGRPLPAATIRFNESDAIRSVPVGPDGRFVLTGPRGGRFTVRAAAPGYLSQAYGDDGGLGHTPVHFEAGAPPIELRIALHRGATIAGRVTDEAGDPVVKTVVHAVGQRIGDIDPRFLSMARTETDDRGEFRITSLPAGAYLVAVARGPQVIFAPASATITGAARVTLAVDQLHEGVRIRVPPQRIGSVTGVVTGGVVAGSSGSRVELMADPLQLGVATVFTRTDASGRFTFDDLETGRYLLIVRPGTAAGQPAAWGRQAVTVAADARAEASIALQSGASIDGRFLPPVGGASMTLVPVGSRPESARMVVRDGGAGFRVTGLPPGQYAWVPPGMGPFSTGVVAVMRNGQDIADLPFDVGDHDVVTGIEVRRLPPSGISGRVVDAAGRPTFAGAVVVVPEDPRYWTAASRRLRLVRADTDGRFDVDRTLPAGRYTLAHVTSLAPGDLGNAAFLRALSGVQVTVATGQTATAELRAR